MSTPGNGDRGGGSKKKERLDQQLLSRGLAASRQKAQALIMSGEVLVNDQPIDKPGLQVPLGAEIRLRAGRGSDYVSRGGDKLGPALDHFGIELKGTVALDVGSSTGGFTDCMLSRGAAKVYAVDVGTNQLDYSLRSDPRVVVMEELNAKDLPGLVFDPEPSFVTIDVSFIGLRKVLLPAAAVLARDGQILALVKPQFELEPQFVESGGVVRSKKHQLLAVSLVEEFALAHRFAFLGSVPSAITGGKKGNQEYFVLLSRIP